MAAIENALYARLQAVSAVTSLVSTRIYPHRASTTNPASPYVTYEVLRTDRDSAMGSDSGCVVSEIRFHVWTQTTSAAAAFDLALSVADALRAALKRWRGMIASTTVEDIFFLDEFTVDEAEPAWAHRIVEFRAHWKE